MEANSTVNLVPFGEDIMELKIRENHDFVVPVNILIPFVHTTCIWATRHTTVCVDLDVTVLSESLDLTALLEYLNLTTQYIKPQRGFRSKLSKPV